MKKQSGFTLIELMVVMAIIAILATAGLSAYVGYLKKGRDTARVSIANQVNTAVNALMGSNGGVPPTDDELLTELASMNMTAAIETLEVGSPTYLSSVSSLVESIGDIVGIPSLFAAIREPSGGKAICLGYDSSGNITQGESCAFRYIVYGDNTYVIGYGVEHESSLQKNFYKIATAESGGAPKYMQVVGTAEYVGLPSIGETGGPAPTAATPFGASKITITDGVVDQPDVSSEIDTDKSAPLSTDYIAPGSIGDNEACTNSADCSSTVCGTNNLCDPCGGACTVGQVCNTEAACVNVCNGTECSIGQVCGTNNTCIDLCGGLECGAGEVCVENECVVPDPCPIKTPGEACSGGAKYAGFYGGFDYMTTPSDLGSRTWGPSNSAGITGSGADGASNTTLLVGLSGTYPAATDCNNLVDFGFDDWFLPSYTEVNSILLPNKTAIGGFVITGGYPASYYWSSQSTYYERAWMTGFETNNVWAEGYRYTALNVRCMRKY